MQMNRSILPLVAIAGLFAVTVGVNHSQAQGSGVPVYYSRSSDSEAKVRASAEKLRLAGKLLTDAALSSQFNRKSCELKLPSPATKVLPGRELWATARASHLRVGWYYLCNDCKNYHLNLAAGYAITKDGAVATCYHVVQKPDNLKEGYIVVADENGEVYPVIEVLAASKPKDVCILKVDARNLKPLPLKTEVFPGDRCVCFSDPLGERGYFSDGIVNRFLVPREARPRGTNAVAAAKSAEPVTRLNVTTDWAPGSSGAAVLDECGNAIGHVTAIATLGDKPAPAAGGRRQTGPTLITLHEAVSAKDVLSLIKKK